jgi:hypothetical protein
MKSGNLNFLEPSGPLQACNGTALRFTVREVYVLQTEGYLSVPLEVGTWVPVSV